MADLITGWAFASHANDRAIELCQPGGVGLECSPLPAAPKMWKRSKAHMVLSSTSEDIAACSDRTILKHTGSSSATLPSLPSGAGLHGARMFMQLTLAVEEVPLLA